MRATLDAIYAQPTGNWYELPMTQESRKYVSVEALQLALDDVITEDQMKRLMELCDE